MNSDLKIIKKYYGEKMMHLCRSLFSTLLEQEGYLSKLMLDNFAPSKFLYEDIINSNYEEGFKNYIYSLVEKEQLENINVNKTPKQLLDDVGYDLYECHTEEDIQEFKKYYAPDEELCTFNGDRLESCHVFFAIKKNVDEIIRENFLNPQRQDEYGTSVISIQFSRGNVNTLSIKNRYNHRVSNPDATYSNNLENIAVGLTNSFEKEYNLNINQNDKGIFELNNYVKANDGKFYKYNYERNNIYYCPDNIIIDNFKVKQYPKEKYIILDYFIIDLVNKKIELYDKKLKDSFIYGIKNIDKINIITHKETGNKQIEITIINKDKIIIILDKTNRIIEYKNNNLRKVGDNFLYYNKTLRNIELENLLYVGDSFLDNNKMMEKLELPKLLRIGNYFLRCNEKLKSLKLPLLMQIYNDFLVLNRELKELELPNLMQVGDYFLFNNSKMKKIVAPKLLEIGNHFLSQCTDLEELFLPKATKIGVNFLRENEELSILNLPNLLELGSDSLTFNKKINYLNLPEVRKIGSYCFSDIQNIIKLEFQKLVLVGSCFFKYNNSVVDIKMPKLIWVANHFFEHNTSVKNFYAPKLKSIGGSFFCENQDIKKSFSNKYLPSIVDFYNEKVMLIKSANLSISKQIKKIIYLYENKNKILEDNSKKK